MAKKPGATGSAKQVPVKPAAAKQPQTKEQAIQQMAEQDPERMAAILRQILRGEK